MIDSSKATMNNFTVPLTLDAHKLAEDLAKQQPNHYKAKQVYLNALAVYAGQFYLRCWGLETNWENCDSFNPTMQMLMDVADLEIKPLGVRVEFRPVLPDEDAVYIPLDVWEERWGYIAVELDDSLEQARLLGFIKSTDTEEVPLSKLQSLKEFIDELHLAEKQAIISPKGAQSINLRNWLHQGVEKGWQTIEEMLATFSLQETPRFDNFGAATALRGTAARRSESTHIPTLIDLLQNSTDNLVRLQVTRLLGNIGKGSQEAIAALTELIQTREDNNYEMRREAAVSLGKIDPFHPQAGARKVKNIDLGIELDGREIALVITIAPESKTEMQLHLRVYPMRTNLLPANLHLTILDEASNIIDKNQSRPTDEYMQLNPLIVEGNSQFTVKVTLNGASFVQEFVL